MFAPGLSSMIHLDFKRWHWLSNGCFGGMMVLCVGVFVCLFFWERGEALFLFCFLFVFVFVFWKRELRLLVWILVYVCYGTLCIMIQFHVFKGVLHPWALFLKTLCIFSKNKATSDKVSYGSGQKCSKELKNHSFTSVETVVVKLQ